MWIVIIGLLILAYLYVGIRGFVPIPSFIRQMIREAEIRRALEDVDQAAAELDASRDA